MSPKSVTDESKINIRSKIKKIFEAAEGQYQHQRLIEKLKKIHRNCDTEESFLLEFTTALRYVFVYQEKLTVDNILLFASKYISLSYSVNADKDVSDSTIDECTPFVNGIFEFIFKSHGASSSDARLRCMQLLSKILAGMPENSLISDETWKKLKEIVLARLQDKNLGVRAQAVLTARMLQDPKNANCEIIKALIFHFNDPSPAVRRSVVSSIALNKLTISHVLKRTRDVNENVRRNAYLVFSKIKPLNLTIKYRVSILERGLQDRSDMVRKCVEQILVVNWLEIFGKNIPKFLEALDVVNCSEVAILTIESILKTQPKEEILKQLPLDEETHLISEEQMTPEVVLLWRCLAEHFCKTGNDEDLEVVLPNLTVLCNHIRGFYQLEEGAEATLNEDEQWAEVKKKEILKHLLHLIKVFDLSDEMGRCKLKELIIDMLISSKIANAQIKFLIELLVSVIPSKDGFIKELTEVIAEIRQPLRTVVTQISNKEKMERDLKMSDLKLTLNELREKEYDAVTSKNYGEAQKLKEEIETIEAELKTFEEQPVTLTQEVSEEKNDPVTLCKCLSILVEMIRYSNVSVLTPELLNLKENFLNHCMGSRDLLTQSLAIEASAQFCILDKELAKENLVRFLLMISEDGDNEINIPSLKGVFDIIQTHGIDCFENLNQNDDGDNSKTKNKTLMTEDRSFHGDSPLYEELNESFSEILCLKHLSALLYCKTNDQLKAIAYEGMCKLLASGVIYSPSILSRIIIKGFSPIIDCESEDFIRQTFMVFFPLFASKTPRSQEMIESAFVSTIKTITNAPLGTPDADINPKDVMNFLLDHTRPDINHFTAKTLHVHNNLALSICHEIYKEISDSKESGYLIPMYVRSLNQLELSLENPAFVQQLKILTGKIEENIKEMGCVRSFYTFLKKLDCKSMSTVSSVENTLKTLDSRSSKCSTNADKSSYTLESLPVSEISRSRRGTRCSSNVINDTSMSDSNDSMSSPVAAKTSRTVVPESPDISD